MKEKYDINVEEITSWSPFTRRETPLVEACICYNAKKHHWLSRCMIGRVLLARGIKHTVKYEAQDKGL
jgi:hypothetical protein